IVAAAQATIALVPAARLPSQYRPTALRIEHVINVPIGDLCAIPLPNVRRTNISPAVYTRNSTPWSWGTSAPITDGNHWSGPNSNAAVIHMHTNSSTKSGLPACRHISAVGTFEATRSVFGYSSDRAIAR